MRRDVHGRDVRRMITLFTQLNGYICKCCHSPKCRHDHRLKQHPKWTVDQLPDGTFTWTTPAGYALTTHLG